MVSGPHRGYFDDLLSPLCIKLYSVMTWILCDGKTLIILLSVYLAFFSRAIRDQNESAIDDSDDKKTKSSDASVSTSDSNQKINNAASTNSQKEKNKNDLKVLGGGDEWLAYLSAFLSNVVLERYWVP